MNKFSRKNTINNIIYDIQNIFQKLFKSFCINDYHELKSYKRGVAQLGSAGALGASTLRT